MTVLYFPAGTEGLMAPPAEGEELTWFDARTGESRRAVLTTPPDAEDWVLVVRRR